MLNLTEADVPQKGRVRLIMIAVFDDHRTHVVDADVPTEAWDDPEASEGLLAAAVTPMLAQLRTTAERLKAPGQ